MQFLLCDIGFSFRSSNVPAKRKIQRTKGNAPERFDDERSCSESESSENDYGDSDYSDDATDGHPDRDEDDSGTERCCTPRGSQTEYSDESD